MKPPRAVVQEVTNTGDPEQVLLIPRQDLSNIPRMQKGLHSRAMRQTWLASNQEKIILNMHQELPAKSDLHISLPCHERNQAHGRTRMSPFS